MKKKILLCVFGTLLFFLPIFLLMILLFSVVSSNGATEGTITEATKDLDATEYHRLGEEFNVDWDIAMLCDMFRSQQGGSIESPLFTILEFCQIKEEVKDTEKVNYYIGKTAIKSFLDIELDNITLDEINKKISELDTQNKITFEAVEDYKSILTNTFTFNKSTISQIESLHKNNYLQLIYKDELEKNETETTILADLNNIGNLKIYATGMPIPHYLQYDSRWGSVPYSCGTVRSAGCGVTSMAMVGSYLTGKTILPDVVARWSTAHGHAAPAGSYWSLFPCYSKAIGINCTDLGKSYNGVINALQSGKPVIASMSPGLFTRGGHFIVLRGITANGRILVNDPNDNFTTKNFYTREFNFSLIYSQAKNFWCFY